MNPSYWDPELVKISRPIIKAVNNARLDADLFTISFDYQFQQFLTEYKSPSWYSQKSNKTSPFPTVANLNNTISINAYYVLEERDMRFWKAYGYRFLFSYNKRFKLKGLLSTGKACYNDYKCSRTTFNNFVSCTSQEKQCSRANLFYPRVYDIRLSRISCIQSNDLIICFGRRWKEYITDFAYDSD